MRHLIGNNQPMNEATYYGKNELLKDFENKCSELQAQASNMDYDTAFKVTLPQMELILEKMFGFQRVFLNFTDKGTCTIPAFISTKSYIPFDSKFKATKGKYGPTFNSKDGIKTYINLGFELFQCKLTPGEMTAVILHEVGHSFSFTVKNRMLLLYPPTIVSSIIVSIMHIGSMNMPKFLERFNTLTAYLKIGKQQVNKIIMNFFSLLNFIPFFGIVGAANLISRALMNPLSMLVPFMQNDDEIFSDAFATSFGYGEELNSALNKFRDGSLDKKIIDKFANDNFFKYIYYQNTIIASLAMMVASPHPRDMERIYNTKKFLLQAIKETSNPKLKAEMEYQLRELEKLEKTVLADMPEEVQEFEDRVEEFSQNNVFIDLRTYLSEYDNQKFFNLDFKKK